MRKHQKSYLTDDEIFFLAQRYESRRMNLTLEAMFYMTETAQEVMYLYPPGRYKYMGAYIDVCGYISAVDFNELGEPVEDVMLLCSVKLDKDITANVTLCAHCAASELRPVVEQWEIQ